MTLDSTTPKSQSMAVSITDTILGSLQLLLSFCWPYPGLCCTVNHFPVVKSFVVKRYCLKSLGPGGLCARCLSPNNDGNLHWRIAGAHETSDPFVNLDWGMHVLFPSTYSIPWVNNKIASVAPRRRSVALILPSCLLDSDPTLWVKSPIKKPIHWLYKQPASFFCLKIPPQFGGYFSFPLSSNSAKETVHCLSTERQCKILLIFATLLTYHPKEKFNQVSWWSYLTW